MDVVAVFDELASAVETMSVTDDVTAKKKSAPHNTYLPPGLRVNMPIRVSGSDFTPAPSHVSFDRKILYVLGGKEGVCCKRMYWAG